MNSSLEEMLRIKYGKTNQLTAVESCDEINQIIRWIMTKFWELSIKVRGKNIVGAVNKWKYN